MKTIKAIFVSQSGLIHEIIGGTVRLFTNSRFAHVALGFDDCIIEAISPRVAKSPITKYDNENVLEVLTLEVTEEQYEKAKAKADSLVGIFYGIDDCIIGGLHDFIGDSASDIAEHFDLHETLDCSAVYTTVIREIYPQFLQGHDPCEITPEVAYEATLEVSNERIS